jgi:hypothetical protein
LGHLKLASATDSLLQAAILLFLFFDVLSYHRFVSTYGRTLWPRSAAPRNYAPRKPAVAQAAILGHVRAKPVQHRGESVSNGRLAAGRITLSSLAPIKGGGIEQEPAPVGVGEPHAALALEVERLGDHPDREDAQFACDARHHRRGAGSGAAAHARGDEHHVSAGQVVADLVDHLFGGGAADIGLRAGTKDLQSPSRPSG